MPLIVTPGAIDANSYATVDEATAYNASRPFASAWIASGNVAYQEPALIQAASLLDMSFSWTGSPTSTDQALCWPRTGMLTINGAAIPSDSIPLRLKNAQAEFARQLLVADREADLDSEKQGISSIRAGSVSVSFEGKGASSLAMMDAQMRRMNPEFYYQSRVVPDAVRLILVPSWYRRPSIQTAPSFDVFR